MDKHSTAYVRYVLGLLFVITMFNYMDRMALAVLSPLIKTELHLTDAQLGLLVGFAFSVFYAICGIPIGRWADRGVRRNIIAIAIATWSVMTALSGAAQTFWHLFLARVGIGAGEAGSIAPGASLLCDFVPLKRRAGAMAIFAFGAAAGILSGMAFAGWLGEQLGWRATFVALGLPGVALAVVVRTTLREPARGAVDAAVGSETTHHSLTDTIRFLWGCRTYRWITLFLVANGFVQYGLNQWWPSFYARVFGLSLSSIGLYLGIAVGASSGVGVLVGGYVANKIGQSNLRRPLILSAIALSFTAPAAASSLFVSSVGMSIALVALTGLLWGVSNGPVLATQYSVVTSRMRATAGALAVFLTSVVGFGLGPYCVGVLSDALAPSLGAESLRYALLFPILATAVMVTSLLAAAKTLLADLRAIGVHAELDGASAQAGVSADANGRAISGAG
jgi:predicted MFS family arabinose efflux permease